MTIPTLKQHAADLSSGKISSVELTQEYLTRIGHSMHNAFITVTPELALEQAKKADEERSSGTSTPLLGVPIAHKDIFCIDGVRTTCGSKILENFIAPLFGNGCSENE